MPGNSRELAFVGDSPTKPIADVSEFEAQMSEMKHYRYQADQAKRLATQVSDPEVRVRLLEMADEYSRYATLIEARTSERHIAG
jgi:hypothetical protein